MTTPTPRRRSFSTLARRCHLPSGLLLMLLGTADATAGVAPERWRAITTAAQAHAKQHAEIPAANGETADAGYFRIDSETCVPLSRGKVVESLPSQRIAVSTALNGELAFRWRLVQRHLPALNPPRQAVQCYYFAP